MATHVWMHNPETDGYWESPAEYVPIAEARGWVKCDPPPPDDSHLYDPEPPREALVATTTVTKAELVAQAEEYGLDTDGTKADIQSRIREHLNLPDAEPGEPTTEEK